MSFDPGRFSDDHSPPVGPFSLLELESVHRVENPPSAPQPAKERW
jgi:hypothetical protein